MIITIRVMTRPTKIRSRLAVSKLYLSLSLDNRLPRFPNPGFVSSMKISSTIRIIETTKPTFIPHLIGAWASPMVDW